MMGPRPFLEKPGHHIDRGKAVSVTNLRWLSSLGSMRAMDKHIIETKATIVEVDGQKYAIVLLAFDYGSPEAKTLISDEIWRLIGKHDNLLTAMWRSDGKLGVVASPEFEEKIRAKILPGHNWVKVRVYPPAGPD